MTTFESYQGAKLPKEDASKESAFDVWPEQLRGGTTHFKFVKIELRPKKGKFEVGICGISVTGQSANEDLLKNKRLPPVVSLSVSDADRLANALTTRVAMQQANVTLSKRAKHTITIVPGATIRIPVLGISDEVLDQLAECLEDKQYPFPIHVYQQKTTKPDPIMYKVTSDIVVQNKSDRWTELKKALVNDEMATVKLTAFKDGQRHLLIQSTKYANIKVKHSKSEAVSEKTTCYVCGKLNKEQGEPGKDAVECDSCEMCEMCMKDTPKYCRGQGAESFKVVVATDGTDGLHGNPLSVDSRLAETDFAKKLTTTWSPDGCYFALTGEFGEYDTANMALEVFNVTAYDMLGVPCVSRVALQRSAGEEMHENDQTGQTLHAKNKDIFTCTHERLFLSSFFFSPSPPSPISV